MLCVYACTLCTALQPLFGSKTFTLGNLRNEASASGNATEAVAYSTNNLFFGLLLKKIVDNTSITTRFISQRGALLFGVQRSVHIPSWIS